MSDFIKTPCQHCPYRKDIRPFLHPARQEELAELAYNQYNTFPCHKTTTQDEDDYGNISHGGNQKQCAGFLSLMHNEQGETFYDDEGFKPSALAFNSVDDMIAANE